MKPPTGLTPRRRQILRFIEKYINNEGMGPTYQEIADHFRISRACVYGFVSALVDNKYLTRGKPQFARNLRVAKGGR